MKEKLKYFSNTCISQINSQNVDLELSAFNIKPGAVIIYILGGGLRNKNYLISWEKSQNFCTSSSLSVKWQ